MGEKIAAKMQLEWVAYGASDVDKAPWSKKKIMLNVDTALERT
jgi:hypothetical protein